MATGYVVFLTIVVVFICFMLVVSYNQASRIQRRRDASFWKIFCRWGLVDRVDLQICTGWADGNTVRMFRIVGNEASKEEREHPLPPPFVDEMRDFVRSRYPRHKFLIQPGKTLAEIKREQNEWIAWCDNANLASG